MGLASTVVIGLLVTAALMLVGARMTELSRAFRAEVARSLGRGGETSVIAEQDLATLPEPVARYLRVSGVVGHARVRSLHARFHGEIRSGPNDAWMSFIGEQYNFYDEPAGSSSCARNEVDYPFRCSIDMWAHPRRWWRALPALSRS